MKLKHSTIEMLIRIKGNNLNWSEAERDIINNAVDIHMECRRKIKQDEPALRKRSKRK